MKVKKYKHLSFEDRCVIEEFLNHNYNFTQISNRLHKNRTCISKEVLKHRFLRGTASPERHCCFESKPPYVLMAVINSTIVRSKNILILLILLTMNINKLLFLKELIYILLKNKLPL